MAYRLKDYLYNDKLTKEQNILMDRLYKLRMSGMAEAFEKQLLEPNTGLEPFEIRFADIVNHEWDQRESKKFKRLMKKASLKYPAADLDSSIYDPERQLNTHVIELLSKCDWIDVRFPSTGPSGHQQVIRLIDPITLGQKFYDVCIQLTFWIID